MNCAKTDSLLTAIMDVVQIGVVIFDQDSRIVLWNQWIESRSGIPQDAALHKTLAELFPGEKLLRLEQSISAAVKHGQSSILSHSLNKAPLPLFASIPGNKEKQRISQSIAIKPATIKNKPRCVLHVFDISASVKREDILRLQGKELKNIATRYQQSEAHARAIIEHMTEALVIIDAGKNVTEFNNAAEHIFGYTNQQIAGKHVSILFNEDDTDLAPYEDGKTHEIMATSQKTGSFPAAVSISRVGESDDSEQIIIFRDLTQRKRFEDQIFRERDFAQVTLESITDAVFTTDQKGNINYINSAAMDMLHMGKQELVGCYLLDILQFASETCRESASSKLQETLQSGGENHLLENCVLSIRNQMLITVDNRISPLRDKSGNIIGSVAVIQDVTDERAMQKQLTYQATHDELTGLINRRELQRRLEDLLIRAKTDRFHSVLMFLDLDRFKVVNDTCGHQAGDQLLKQLTQRMLMHVRSTDTLARLGGDEFAVLLTGCSIDIAENIADTIRESVNGLRFGWNERYFSVGVSIGLALINHNWSDSSTLMSAADAACYMAKERGRDQHVVYHQNGDEEQRHHGEMLWVSRIREALEENRFQLYCQPIMPIGQCESQLISCEVLVRMLDKKGGIILPMAFIPPAERFNLMIKIDEWVITSITELWQRSPETFDSFEKCAINLSGQSIANDKFQQFVYERIIESGYPWERLCFEITETAAMANLDAARKFMDKLRRRGCSFSLDDFGSGVSSFGYLKHLPVDYLKIDGTFVKDMLTDRIDAAVVKSISEVGQTLGMKTIAEFVDGEEVIRELEHAGVHYAQGFGVCKPVPLEEYKTLYPQVNTIESPLATQLATYYCSNETDNRLESVAG